MTRNARIGLLLAAVAVAVVAFVVVGTGGDSEQGGGAATTALPAGPATTSAPPRPSVAVVRVRGGSPVGGARTLEFRGGERIRFVVASDTAVEVHVHGYDVTRRVPAGGRATFSFDAGPQGVFEVESHETGRELARLRVVP